MQDIVCEPRCMWVPNPRPYSPDAIVGQSPGMQKVYKTIGRVAQTDATVLIQGESGTGKELVARAVYQHGIRSDKNFFHHQLCGHP